MCQTIILCAKQVSPVPRTITLEDIWLKLDEVCNKLDNVERVVTCLELQWQKLDERIDARIDVKVICLYIVKLWLTY